VIANITFERNIATSSGRALKLLYKDPRVYAKNTFKDNSDPFGISVSDSEPSYYRFSFYKMLTDKKIKSDEELYELMENSSLTVISFFIRLHIIHLQRLEYTFNTSGLSENPPEFLIKQKSGHDLAYILLVEIFDTDDQLANYITNE